MTDKVRGQSRHANVELYPSRASTALVGKRLPEEQPAPSGHLPGEEGTSVAPARSKAAS